MQDFPFSIIHHDARHHDLPSAVDAEIYIPRGHVGSLAELVGKADAYDAICETEEFWGQDGGVSGYRIAILEIIRRERAARINRDIETAEAPPQLTADAR